MKKLISATFAILMSLPLLAQAADVAAGKAKFQQLCASCHGANGKGDGPAAAILSQDHQSHIHQKEMNIKQSTLQNPLLIQLLTLTSIV